MLRTVEVVGAGENGSDMLKIIRVHVTQEILNNNKDKLKGI